MNSPAVPSAEAHQQRAFRDSTASQITRIILINEDDDEGFLPEIGVVLRDRCCEAKDQSESQSKRRKFNNNNINLSSRSIDEGGGGGRGRRTTLGGGGIEEEENLIVVV
ncbi:hypothetical protein ACFE04_010968 [Oxalis oulophora]